MKSVVVILSLCSYAWAGFLGPHLESQSLGNPILTSIGSLQPAVAVAPQPQIILQTVPVQAAPLHFAAPHQFESDHQIFGHQAELYGQAQPIVHTVQLQPQFAAPEAANAPAQVINILDQLPEKSLPELSLPEASLPEKSLLEKSLSGKSLLEKTLIGKTLLEKSLLGKELYDKFVPQKPEVLRIIRIKHGKVLSQSAVNALFHARQAQNSGGSNLLGNLFDGLRRLTGNDNEEESDAKKAAQILKEIAWKLSEE